MRKLFLSALVLSIVAAAVFFVGWVQFSVPVGKYAVMRSKTSGVSAEVLEAGRFRWAWQRLLPTNVRLYPFSLKGIDKEFSASGTLPSAELYAPLLGMSGGFDYGISGTVSFKVRPEALPGIVEKRGVATQEDLDQWIAATSDAVASFIAQRVLSYAQDRDEREHLAVSVALPRLNGDVEREFPELSGVTCVLKTFRMPDLEVYDAARALYKEFLERRKGILAAAQAKKAEDSVRLQDRLEEMELMGELLNKYPVLMKYLALQTAARSGGADLFRLLEE